MHTDSQIPYRIELPKGQAISTLPPNASLRERLLKGTRADVLNAEAWEPLPFSLPLSTCATCVSFLLATIASSRDRNTVGGTSNLFLGFGSGRSAVGGD